MRGVGGGGGEPRLIPEFGELANAAVQKSLVNFDDAAGKYLLKHSLVAQHIRMDLTYEMYNNLGDAYKTQLDLIQRLCLDKFKADQRGVQIMANISNVVKGLVDDCVVVFKPSAKRLKDKGYSRSGSKSK